MFLFVYVKTSLKTFEPNGDEKVFKVRVSAIDENLEQERRKICFMYNCISHFFFHNFRTSPVCSLLIVSHFPREIKPICSRKPKSPNLEHVLLALSLLELFNFPRFQFTYTLLRALTSLSGKRVFQPPENFSFVSGLLAGFFLDR